MQRRLIGKKVVPIQPCKHSHESMMRVVHVVVMIYPYTDMIKYKKILYGWLQD